VENGGLGKQPFKRLQFGGSGGGPLAQNRAWFFGSLERVSQDFQLPRSPVAIQQLNLLTPANLGVDIGVSVGGAVPQPYRDLLSQGKVNVQINPEHGAFIRYATQYGYVDNGASGIGNSRGLLACCDVLARNNEHLWTVSGGETWIINPTTVNEFRAQYAYYLHDDENKQQSTDYVQNALGRLSFPSGVATGANNFFPHWYNREEKLQLKNDFSKQIGSHAWKLGVDYTRFPVFYANLNTPGTISFFDDPSVIVSNSNGKYPQGFQTPGAMRSITAATNVEVYAQSKKAWSFAGYVQDDYKVSPRFTLNLGVRYDVHEMMDNCCWDQNRTYQVLKAIGNPYGRLPSTDTNNIAPRLGFAWDLKGDGKNVVRGSYGLFYGTGIITAAYSQILQEQDFVYFTQAYTNTAVGVGQLANFVYGVTPLPRAPEAPTDFPKGVSLTGAWNAPNLEDPRTRNAAVGVSHLFSGATVISVDYVHVNLDNGWMRRNINPLLPNPANPNGARIRPLAAATLATLGDPNFFSAVNILFSDKRATYDGLDVHFEHRFSKTAVTVNYTLSKASGTGGDADFTTQGGFIQPQTPTVDGGDISAPWEFGPTNVDERHRVTVVGVMPLPWGFEVAPSFTAATARPYTQFRATNPSGDGSLQVLCASGDSNDVGFGVGQVPCGVNNARGVALINANARLTKNFGLSPRNRISLFAEFYNILNRANFGNSYFGNAFSPATYNQPNGYLGGIGSTTTIPISFQVQFGARYAF
jgi:hypothetical protein